MARTNFAALTNEEKTIWSMQFWKQVRNKSFVSKFIGSSESAMIQRITELRKDEKGARCVMTLVADLEGDGVAGDNTLEGREEAMVQDEQVVRLDQLRHANINKGRMADQKSIVNFREQSRDKLAYWFSDRLDQMAFLALSGVGYAYHTDGRTRVGSQLGDLEFAADVAAPSANRHWYWHADNGLVAGDTSAVTVAKSFPTYKMLVEMRAKAEVTKLKPISGQGGDELYHVFLHPYAFAKLRQDADYLANVRNAGVRGADNELFGGTGGMVTQDGLVLHSYRHVYNTTGLAAGSKWQTNGNVDGCRLLMCGSQALGFGDIGNAQYIEDDKDYENQQGISYGKIFGMLKPKFTNNATRTTEDFGVMCVDVAIGGSDT
jgi:N4-gp56 family major capsid protein